MTSALRAALYLRVSTTRQVEVDLSIPDQKLQCQTYCARNAWTVIDTYVEPGASAMDDQRPEFQRLIERACDDDHPVDVYSPSGQTRGQTGVDHSRTGG